MAAPRAVIFDLGGTLVYWPEWDEDAPRRWGLCYADVAERLPDRAWPDEATFVDAMRAAEAAHWRRVDTEHWSGPPSSLVADALRQLGRHPREDEVLAVLDGYARAVDGWAVVLPDAVETLQDLRRRGYRLGLLSNTWWAADWHNAELATHGLAALLDEVVYTSDLPHSKPHPTVFLEVARRLDAEPSACVMVGDRLVDDVDGALAVGMRAVWRRTETPWPRPEHVRPTAALDDLRELAPLLQSWGGR